MARYHHGDLRQEVLRGAVEEIEANGPSAVSLRAVARRAGVSHAAPAHHFGDKAGVLSALAEEGYRGLAETTAEALDRTGDLLEVGIAYVRFALDHRAHFEVMFRPELYRRDDPGVAAARDAAAEVLFRAVRDALGPDAAEDDVLGGVLAAWSLGDDPEAAARRAALAFVRIVQARGLGT